MKIIGSYLSPYVRKVLVCLDLKGVEYEIDPIVPYFGSDGFERVSPLRRVPVLIDDAVTLSDSTVICEYLEERCPEPALMPRGAEARARCRWLEEYADTRMGEVFIWHYYNQFVIRKYVWGQPPEPAVLQNAIEVEIPQVMDYLESELPDEGFLFGAISVADIAIAAFFRNAAFARYTPDEDRWPVAAVYIPRVLAVEAFQRLVPFEELTLKTPIPEHRAALAAAGAPVSEDSYGTSTPRPGLLST